MMFLPRPETMSFAGLIFAGLILLIGNNPIFWIGLFVSTIMMVFTFVITIPDGWE